MKIVLLDKLTLGNTDLSLIKNEGELIEYPTSTKEECLERIKEANVIITNKVYIGKEEMNIAKNLKLICVAATGYNNIDIDYAREKGIKVANVSGYSSDSVAQLSFTFILAIQNSLIEYTEDVKKLKWSESPIFTMLTHPIISLKNQNLGIIGYGSIGKRLGEIGKAFGMNLLIAGMPGKKYDEERMSLEEVLKNSDVISIHCPLTKETENLISEKELNLMKKEAILINTARGKIVNEKDLYEALKNKKIKAAALDVSEYEPIKKDNPLLKLDNILITPHIAWAADKSMESLIKGISENIKNFKIGNLKGIV